jgi:1,2-diacylglycerol-3-alpha-glucose alpha-1,2-galactosyltransferase
MAKGQGVDSAFKEQAKLLKKSKILDVFVNDNKIYDIVHAHTFDLGSRSLLKKYKSKGKKTVISCHVMPDSLEGSLKIPTFILKYLVKYMINFYSMADRLVVVNSFYKQELIKLGLPKEKVVYIPNYVSREVFKPVENAKKQALRKEFGINEDEFVVVGAGQVQKRKGIDDFIKTAKKCPEYKFIWVGGFSFGKMTDGYEKYKKVIENPPSNVIFTGIVERERVADYFNASDVLFLPSYQELFPMTILEACNCHLPLLVRDIDLYEDILFRKYMSGNNSDDFTKKLHDLSNNKELFEKIKQKAIEISEYYSESNVMKIWEDFYTQLLEKK